MNARSVVFASLYAWMSMKHSARRNVASSITSGSGEASDSGMSSGIASRCRLSFLYARARYSFADGMCAPELLRLTASSNDCAASCQRPVRA